MALDSTTIPTLNEKKAAVQIQLSNAQLNLDAAEAGVVTYSAFVAQYELEIEDIDEAIAAIEAI